MKKLAIAIPLNWAYIPAAFAVSLVQVVAKAIELGLETKLFFSNKSLISTMRERLVQDTMEWEPDYILWLDADQTYPPETVERLISHVDSGMFVVGGMTPDKRTGIPLVFMEKDGQFYRPDQVDVKQGCVQVDGMGFGGVMTHPYVFGWIQPPYFNMRVNDDRKMSDKGDCPAIEGEDLTFYSKCKEKKIGVWLDTDLPYQHIVVSTQKVKGL